ncbi:MAG TPA: hypothetical protein VF462_10140 [Micromonosporaceae bacterium]
MTIDAAVVQERLRLLRDLLADLDLAGDVTSDRLQQDRIVRHAVEPILMQLVDLAVSLAREGFRRYVAEAARFLERESAA